MAYYLASTSGGGNLVDLATPVNFTGDGYIFELDFVYRGAIGLALISGVDFEVRINNASSLRISDGAISAFPSYPTLVIGQRYTFKLKRTGVALQIFDENDVAFSNTRNITSGTLNINRFLAKQDGSSSPDLDVYRLKLYQSDVVIHDYDPSASGGTGLILPDTVGGNDGTLINFPTDDSQWVFYPDAGGGVTGSSAFNLPKLTLSATGSATQPQPIGNGAFSLNLLTVSSSGTATLPQPEISGAFSLQPVTVSSTGTATLPQPNITGAFSFNALNVSSTGTATLPQPNINGSFSYPLLTVDASGSATTANPFINGNITFNKLTVASTGSATLPQPDITGAFSLPKLTVEGTASALVPQPIINGNIALSKLTISATGEVTLPQPIANGAFNIPFITVSGFATISGLQLIIDRETNINQQFLSANINQKNLSNNFIYH